jgi:hypothetical protein
MSSVESVIHQSKLTAKFECITFVLPQQRVRLDVRKAEDVGILCEVKIKHVLLDYWEQDQFVKKQ